MRLQTMLVPSEGTSVQWALVLDQVRFDPPTPAQVQRIRDDFEAAAKRLGAVGVLIFSETVEVL